MAAASNLRPNLYPELPASSPLSSPLRAVIPNDPIGTLGKAIGILRNDPSKWKLTLTEKAGARTAPIASIDVLILMLDLLWRNQTDRHASGDDRPARPISQQQAEFAVHLALPLVQVFVTGAVSRAT
jgi:hypothetical protein